MRVCSDLPNLWGGAELHSGDYFSLPYASGTLWDSRVTRGDTRGYRSSTTGAAGMVCKKEKARAGRASNYTIAGRVKIFG